LCVRRTQRAKPEKKSGLGEEKERGGVRPVSAEEICSRKMVTPNPTEVRKGKSEDSTCGKGKAKKNPARDQGRPRAA